MRRNDRDGRRKRELMFSKSVKLADEGGKRTGSEDREGRIKRGKGKEKGLQ